MTTPNFADAAPLLTPDDVLQRVEDLVGTAAADRTLWIMWVDGDGRQAPTVMPVEQCPRRPDAKMFNGLVAALGAPRDELGTELGPGSVILTLERFGPEFVLPDDRAWVDYLVTACEHADIPPRGVFLSTRAGVRPLR